MNTKTLNSTGLKSIDERGKFTACFATLNVIDKQSDVILPGAIIENQAVKISSWGHAWESLPVGKGTVHEVGNELVVKGKFFMETEAGNQTYLTLRGLEELGQWSFGFKVLQSKNGDFSR